MTKHEYKEDEYRKHRIKHEKQELDHKRDRLETFCAGETFSALSIHQQYLLQVQSGIMYAYGNVLQQRIEAMRKEES